MAHTETDATRPLLGRIRQALFDSLAAEVDGAAFLDLFAGTGAVGIEALSRGAASAVFVERRDEAAKVIEENLAGAGVADRARVVRGDAVASVARLVSADELFDVVFLGPPYFSEDGPRALASVAESGIVREGGTVVYQRDRRELMPPAMGLSFVKTRSYGRTRLDVFLRPG